MGDLSKLFEGDIFMATLNTRIRATLVDCMKEREIHTNPIILNEELKGYRVEGIRALLYVTQLKRNYTEI